MSFLSLTWNEGVFALKLDFAFFRTRAAPVPKAKKKKLGPKPLPPPFPLPPLKNVDDDLFDALALAAPEPQPAPSVIVDASLQEEPAPTRLEVPSASPDATLLMDEDEVTAVSPLRGRDTDLCRQRHAVRKALRGVAR